MNFSNTSLFVGDLPKFCSEQDLEQLFQSYGPVLDAKIKRNVNTGKTLSYGFVTLTSEAAAAEALKGLDNTMFSGRKLRIRWAMYNAKTQTPTNTGIINSVYIRFVTPRTDRLVTEEDLHNVFDAFGSVLDVSIKESSVDPRTGRQSGYGFVHFACDQSGVDAAFQAVAALDNAIIDGITYNVELSKNLLKQFGERQNAEAVGPLPPPPIVDVTQSPSGFTRIPSQNSMPIPSPRNMNILVPPPIVIPGGANNLSNQGPSPKWVNQSPNHQLNTNPNNYINRSSPYGSAANANGVRTTNPLSSPNLNPALIQQSRLSSANTTPVHSQSSPDFYANLQNTSSGNNGLPRTLSNNNNRGSVNSPNANPLHRIGSFGGPGSGNNTPSNNTPNMNSMRTIGARSVSNNNMNAGSTSLLYTLNNTLNNTPGQEYFDANANAVHLRNASFRSDPGSYNNNPNNTINNPNNRPYAATNTSPGHVIKSVNSLHSIPSNHSLGGTTNERHLVQNNTSQYSIMSNSSYHSVHSDHSLFNMSESYDPQSHTPSQQAQISPPFANNRGNSHSNNAMYHPNGSFTGSTSNNYPILSVKSTDSDESDTYESEPVYTLHNTNKDDFFEFLTTTNSGNLQLQQQQQPGPSNTGPNAHNTSGHSFYSNGSNSSNGTSPGHSSTNVLGGLVSVGSGHNLHTVANQQPGQGQASGQGSGQPGQQGIAMTASASADYSLLNTGNVPHLPVQHHMNDTPPSYYHHEYVGGGLPTTYGATSTSNPSSAKNSPMKSNSFLLQQQQQQQQLMQQQQLIQQQQQLQQLQQLQQYGYTNDAVVHAQQQQQQYGQHGHGQGVLSPSSSASSHAMMNHNYHSYHQQQPQQQQQQHVYASSYLDSIIEPSPVHHQVTYQSQQQQQPQQSPSAMQYSHPSHHNTNNTQRFFDPSFALDSLTTALDEIH